MRRSELSRRTPLARGGRLSMMSQRRRSQLPQRHAVLVAALARDGGCVARTGARFDLGTPCGARPGRAPLEGNELVRRSAWAAGWLVLDNVVMLCPAHHDWVTEHPAEAHRAGLQISRWELDNERD